MTDIPDFDQQGRKFWGGEHFPYGLSRSGEFTREQVQLLEDHFFAYDGLARGEREPRTETEEEFLEFCQGRAPQNKHEKTWARFVQKTSQAKLYVTLGSSANDDDGGVSEPLDMEDY